MRTARSIGLLGASRRAGGLRLEIGHRRAMFLFGAFARGSSRRLVVLLVARPIDSFGWLRNDRLVAGVLGFAEAVDAQAGQTKDQ